MKARYPFFYACLIALLGYVGNVPTALAQTDTTRQLPVIRPATDTLPPANIADDEMDVLVDSLAPAVDTVQVSPAAQAILYTIVPRKATIRSAILPGWGQYYNRQYWKVPVVAAGFATFAYILIDFTRRYNYFINEYAAAYPTDSTGRRQVLSAAQTRSITRLVTVNGVQRDLSLDQLRQLSDFWRRWRDYNIIFTALFWGLNVVDANVSAHLKTFDVSDSLTLKYAPTILPTGQGFVPGVKLTLAFRK